METTDNYDDIGHQPQAGAKNLIWMYGLMLGVFSILLSVIKYVTSSSVIERTWWDQLAGMVFMIAFICIPIVAFKKQNGGFIGLGEAIKIGLGVAAVGAVIGCLYFFVFTSFIEPTFADQVLSAQQSEALKQNPNVTDAQLKEGMEMGRKFFSVFLYGGIIVVNLFFGLIISLICGLAIRRENK